MTKLEIGVLSHLSQQPEDELNKVVNLGLHSCQVCSWESELWTAETGKRLASAAKSLGVTISSFWAGYPGPRTWNFTEGPKTIGLPPRQWRDARVAALQNAARFAADNGMPSVTTHVGFIPEDPGDPLYGETLDALAKIVEVCRQVGVEFWFETGQETPVTLLRTITRLGTKNLGINLDPANLILYGKANPVDSLDVFGTLVRGVHAKDGMYPTDGDRLGKETALGEGKVNFQALIPKLKAMGYTGPLTIEREISGDKQIEDIRKAIRLLEPLC